jgi:esterase/lipase superfamily enzyme
MDWKRQLSISLLLIAAVAVTACTRPHDAALLAVSDYAETGHFVPVLSASMRSAAPEGSSEDLIAQKGIVPVFESYKVSIPPNHEQGQVEFQGNGDAQNSFAVVKRSKLGPKGFLSTLDARLGSGGNDVFVFVHGFNTTYAEGVFRAAQLLHDSGTREPGVLVAWPSFARLLRYSADQERALATRDFLEQVLEEIAARPKTGRIHIVAHSMGSMLTMEALRQASIGGNSGMLHKIESVNLMAPDIDYDVFNQQLDSVESLQGKVTVVVTKDDIALTISKQLAGDLQRVGNIDASSDPRARSLKKRGVKIIDLSDAPTCGRSRHSKYACLARVLRERIGGGAEIAAQ